MANLVLVAPMQGWVSPLSEVPDPVFSGKLLGDGIAIDPVGATVRAPCDGMITSSAKHAVTLRAENGAEILIHVGLETVALHGQGFVSEVREGKSVRTGDPLLSFDLEFLAANAKSLISPIVLTNGDDFAIVRCNQDRETALGEFLMEIRPLREAVAVAAASQVSEISRDVAIMLAHGIHARPAAVLSNCARRFSSDISIHRNGRRVNAKSAIALMSLGIKHGEDISVVAFGSDAATAVAAVADLIVSGLGEAPAAGAAPAVVRSAPQPKPVAGEAHDKVLRGVCAARGMAVGQAFRFKPGEIPVNEVGNGIAPETAELNRAIGEVRAKLELASTIGDRQRREILSAHLALLDDPEILQSALAQIEKGKSAGFAWRVTMQAAADGLRAIDDPLMRERAHDLLDLESQVAASITGQAPAVPCFPENTILLADELLPSQILALSEASIAGFCTAGGGPTSHVAILAAAMGLPALVSAGPGALQVVDGTPVILDADNGVLSIAPGDAALREARVTLDVRNAKAREALTHALEDCHMADGTRIEVFANLGAGADEALAAVKAGAEGCGLLRTEFLFLDRETPPTEEEQLATYQGIADALAGRPFIIRTFDIGGDKPVPYLPFPPEENPALGLRGVRAGLWREDLLRTQLAAILRIKPAGQARIMLPMVTSLSELRAVRTILESVQRERDITTGIALGIMVETPASALLADQLAREADFISVGTNDLTQYVLAMDRQNAQLAAQIDAFHPAVLRLISQAAKGARASGKQAGMCGGLAADPLAAPFLIGMGIDELSVPPSAIPGLKATIRKLDIARCREAAERALNATTPEETRAIAREFSEGTGA